MRVCYFGTYSKGEGYPRNTVIIEGLKRVGVDVVECHANLWKDTQDKINKATNIFIVPKIFLQILKAYLNLLLRFSKIKTYDVIIVGYIGQFDIFLARILNFFRGSKPIIFNAFLSLYDTVVNDRRIVSPHSIKAKFLRFADRYACLIADKVIMDTNQHIDFFVQEFNLKPEKFVRVFVGENDRIFHPMPVIKKNDSYLTLLHFGTVLKFHGAEYIVQAAKMMEKYEDIHFTIIGPGQTGEELKPLMKDLEIRNIKLVTDWLSYETLVKYIASADIGLGSFGNIGKAQRVIPHKVMDFLAMAKPLITGDTTGAREVLVHKENAILCEIGNASAIVEAILLLKNDPELRNKIAQNGYALYKNHFTPEAIGRSVVEYLETVFK